MSKSFYQKYRPIQLEHMIGQERVVKSILCQAEKNEFGHAYVFSGQFGGGKTTMARMLATLLTCQHKKRPNQVCAVCKSCQSIHIGQSVDVIEIDAATNGGVDNIRKLKEDAYYAPQELKYKIYIIDEAHQLSTSAWNALLKIIEEPPEYVVFMFCTTEHRKIPSTILSRCRRYLFNKVPSSAIAGRLMQVAKKEAFELEEAASLAIAKMSEGSVRDALSMLEDIMTVTSGKVTAQAVKDYYGQPERRLIYEILTMVAERNASGVLDRIDDLLLAGADVKSVAMELSIAFRNAMLIDAAGESSKLLDIDQDEKEILKKFVNKISRNGLIGIARSFGRIDRELELNINSRWILEAVLLNCIFHVATEASKPKS